MLKYDSELRFNFNRGFLTEDGPRQPFLLSAGLSSFLLDPGNGEDNLLFLSSGVFGTIGGRALLFSSSFASAALLPISALWSKSDSDTVAPPSPKQTMRQSE